MSPALDVSSLLFPPSPPLSVCLSCSFLFLSCPQTCASLSLCSSLPHFQKWKKSRIFYPSTRAAILLIFTLSRSKITELLFRKQNIVRYDLSQLQWAETAESKIDCCKWKKKKKKPNYFFADCLFTKWHHSWPIYGLLLMESLQIIKQNTIRHHKCTEV